MFSTYGPSRYPLLLALFALRLHAQPVLVPNGSFESPSTVFVDNRVDDWKKTPKPFWYDEGTGYAWDQLSGVFHNTDPGKVDHIDNCEGTQGYYLFAVPQVGLFQDRLTRTAQFQVGKSYALTAGIVGGAGGMKEGVSLEMSLYFRDAAGNPVVVASTNILHDATRFTNQTHFVDVLLRTPPVRPGDLWAGQSMGVQFLSTVDPAKAGGYWDLDQVRLEEVIEIPNGSFESPATAFVDTRVEHWQKTPKPVWYDEGVGYTWDQLAGVFRNSDPGKPDHITNTDAAQGYYLFAIPTVGLFQDQFSTNASGITTTPPFNVRFEPGKSYVLTAGVLGGGGNMLKGVTLDLSLYYRDDAGNPVTVARTTVTHDPAVFPTLTKYVDFQVRTPAVKAADAWAGRNIGVQVLSTVASELVGGYWDLDQFRLTAVPEPVLLNPRRVADQLEFTLQSEPGLRFEILASASAMAPASAWTVVSTITNTGNFIPIRVPLSGSGAQYFQVKRLP